MRHGSKKIKLNFGRDANRMLVRKLASSFIRFGKITATEKRIKILKSVIEKIVEKAKRKTEADKNYLLKQLANIKLVKVLFDQIGPVFVNQTGGCVRIIKLAKTNSRSTKIARLEWTHPVVISTKTKSNNQSKKIKPAVKNNKKISDSNG